MDNLNNNSNNDNVNNNNVNNDNSNNDNSNNDIDNVNNENPNIRTFYFNPTQSNEDILQQITSFINNISNINQVNHENNTNSMDENNNDNLGNLDGSNMNQNIQMFFEIEFLMNPENIGGDDEDETSHFDDCNHINEILGKAIYIKKDDPILGTDCGICMDNYKYKQYKRILPECKHTFHKKCIDNWFKKNSSCPVCRKDFLTVQNNES